MEAILKILDSKMITPSPFGWFHWLFIIITILSCVLIPKFTKNLDDKQNSKLLFYLSILFIVMEIYKQIIFSYDCDTGNWKYKWHAFPYQFCSLPMYLTFIVSFLKKSKLKDAIYMLLATYSIVAGIAVMLVPSTVFTSTIGVNIHTMVHHSLMVIIGIYLLSTNRVQLNIKNFINAIYLFLASLTLALILNITVHNISALDADDFNMFYISPYFNTPMSFLDDFQNYVPYPIFLFSYIGVFTLGAYLVYLLAKHIKKHTIKQ